MLKYLRSKSFTNFDYFLLHLAALFVTHSILRLIVKPHSPTPTQYPSLQQTHLWTHQSMIMRPPISCQLWPTCTRLSYHLSHPLLTKLSTLEQLLIVALWLALTVASLTSHDTICTVLNTWPWTQWLGEELSPLQGSPGRYYELYLHRWCDACVGRLHASLWCLWLYHLEHQRPWFAWFGHGSRSS